MNWKFQKNFSLFFVSSAFIFLTECTTEFWLLNSESVSASYTTIEREKKWKEIFCRGLPFYYFRRCLRKVTTEKEVFNNFFHCLTLLSNIYRADVKVHYLSSVKRRHWWKICEFFPFSRSNCFRLKIENFKFLVMQFRYKHGWSSAL